MFEIGKEYTVWMAHPGGASSFTGILLKAELPLLCIEHGQGERIVNVNSSAFVSADRADAETAAAIHHRREAARLADGIVTGGDPVDIVQAFEAHKDDAPLTPGSAGDV
jgi:hypothetical protein